jgi:acetyl-CoA acetyltransferase
MEAKLAQDRGLSPPGGYRGMAVAGTPPEEMGIGPVHAVPKLLARHGLSVDDIGQWELSGLRIQAVSAGSGYEQ